jgi:transposase
MLYWESMKSRKSKISKKKQIKLVEYFVAGATARIAAILTEVNRKTAQRFFCKLRKLIIEKQDEKISFTGEIEADESYFGGKRKGKRGRGAAGKIPVFGLLKRRGKVYAAVIPNVKTETLLPIINDKIFPDSIVYTDTLPSYNALDVSDLKHRRINHSKLFAHEKNHINGIENFWNQAKRTMRNFNGIPKNNFNLFLKECEWRFNFPSPKKQLEMLIRWMNLDV